MSELEITRDDVGGRARVWKMAPNDPKAAAIAAHRIRHPWYRCQALTRAAEFSNGPRRSALLDSAFEAAREQREPNRIVTVSSWPIRVLAGFSPERTAELIGDLVKIAETEPHNLRRAHALQMLAFSISSQPELLRLIVPAMVATVLGGGGTEWTVSSATSSKWFAQAIPNCLVPWRSITSQATNRKSYLTRFPNPRHDKST